MATEPPSQSPQPPPPDRTPTVKSKAEQKNDRIITALSAVFTTGPTTGAFFAGFTLNIVVYIDATDQPHVRLYAAICSLLFVLLVLMCSAGSVVFAYYQDEFVQILNDKAPGGNYGWESWHLWVVFGVLPTFLFTILTAGVLFFLLIVRAYEEGVALVGFVVIGMGAVCGGVGWVCLLASYTTLGSGLIFWKRKKGAKETGDIPE